jgi:hypothetical protein
VHRSLTPDSRRRRALGDEPGRPPVCHRARSQSTTS